MLLPKEAAMLQEDIMLLEQDTGLRLSQKAGTLLSLDAGVQEAG